MAEEEEEEVYLEIEVGGWLRDENVVSGGSSEEVKSSEEHCEEKETKEKEKKDSHMCPGGSGRDSGEGREFGVGGGEDGVFGRE